MATGTIINNNWTPIWTNPNHTVAQSAFNISMDLSGYSECRVLCKKAKSSAYYEYHYARIGDTMQFSTMWLGAYRLVVAQRSITITTAGISVNDDIHKDDPTSSSSPVTNNDDNIIVEIAVR